MKDACVNQITVVGNDATIRKSTLSQESPLTATGWLDDVARWQGEHKDSCQVTVGVDVTGFDVSISASCTILAAILTNK